MQVFEISRKKQTQNGNKGNKTDRNWWTLCVLGKHYENMPKNLPPKKNENFQIKKSDIFLISAKNIDCVYSLEPPRRGGSNEYS